MNMTGNPVTQTPKYRDNVTMLSMSIETLDNKKITPQERRYLLTLHQRKMAKMQ